MCKLPASYGRYIKDDQPFFLKINQFRENKLGKTVHSMFKHHIFALLTDQIKQKYSHAYNQDQ